MAKHAKIETIEDKDLDEELVELEFDEESVSYYIVDEDDNEIGVCLIEDGQEVEYMYEDYDEDEEDSQINASKEAVKKQTQEMSESLKNMKGELEFFKDDATDVAKELKDTADELKDMLNEVKDSFKIFPKNKAK